MLNFFWGQSRGRGIKWVLFASCIALLAACGGGGSSGGNKTASSSSVAALVANAGADLTVNAGTKINLDPHASVVGAGNLKTGQGHVEVTGASTNPTDIVAITWTPIEGPVVSIEMNSTTSAAVFFIAPTTGTENSIKISYRLTVTNAAGIKAEDTVTFTILRVNQAPVVNAGIDRQADALTGVNFTAVASDIDGTVVSYQWVQTAGATVNLFGADTASVSFLAPSTEVDAVLEFELSVVDNNGLIAKDTISLGVTPENAPQLQLYFPPASGVYEGSEISVFGSASPKLGSLTSLTSVTVDIGTGPVAATVDSDGGSWRIDGLQVPVAGTEFSVQVIATDDVGHSRKTTAKLKKSGDYNGIKAIGSRTWSKSVGVAVDSVYNVAYVLAKGDFLQDVRLFSIDLATGNQLADISNFSDVRQGISPSAVVAMTYDPHRQLVFVSTNPADVTQPPQIFSIDTMTGQRKLVSDNTRGTGVNFVNPTGLSMGGNLQLYVADNISSTILAVDIVTGNRTLVANPSTSSFGIDAPLRLVVDNSNQDRLFMVPNVETNYVLELNLSATPATSALVTNSDDSSQGSVTIHSEPRGIVVDSGLNALFIADESGHNEQIVKVDLATGDRTKLLSTGLYGANIAYSTEKQLLYVTGGLVPGLLVVDPLTAQKVLISR